MSLKGTLDDFSIVELLQFPYAGRKTGRLDITDPQGRTTTAYYREGKLVHAVSGSLQPFEAIVSLVSWEHGDFVFHPDLQTDRTTLELDLHRLLMQALKTRDERRFAEEKQRETGHSRFIPIEKGSDSAGRLRQKLRELAGKMEGVRYVAVLASDNRPLAEVGLGNEQVDFVGLRNTLMEFWRAQNQRQPSRILLESDEGSAALVRIDDERLLLVIAGAGQALGAVAASVRKIAQALTKV